MSYRCPSSHPHNTNCYNRHRCRCGRCRATRQARVPYERRARFNAGANVHIPATGTMRRLQALAAIGYGSAAIAQETGVHTRHVTKLRDGDLAHVRVLTAARIATVYDRLSHLPITTRAGNITRAVAARHGWAPPLAWDNIDTDREPSGVRA